MPLENIILRVNDVDLNVIDTGARDGSPCLVFLHYWGGSSRTWMPVMEKLSIDYRCVAIDFRGWGRSTKSAKDHSLDALATDVIQVAKSLGLSDFILVGHSMGGKVAQLVAAQHPQELKGLILFAPAPPTPMTVPEEARKGYVALYQSRQAVTDVLPGALTPHPLSEAVRAQIVEDTLCGSLGAKEEWPLRGMIRDVSHEAAMINVPVHVIAGGDDSVEPAASLRSAFGLLSRVTFSSVPGVGHIAPLENPETLAAAIRTAAQAHLPTLEQDNGS
jgi:pimeloyl-ACP methyl ester carboxylesterase